MGKTFLTESTKTLIRSEVGSSSGIGVARVSLARSAVLLGLGLIRVGESARLSRIKTEGLGPCSLLMVPLSF